MSINGVAAGDVVRAIQQWDMPNTVQAQTVHTWYRSDTVPGLIPFVSMIGYLDTKLTAMFTELGDAVADVVTAGVFTGYTMHYPIDEWVVEAYMGQGLVDWTGTGVGDMAPHGVAGLVSYPTPYPKTRGKTYLPGFGDTAFTGSVLSAGSKTLVEAYADEYLTAMEPGGGYIFVPVLLSYKSGTSVLLTSRVVGTYAAYQRRRRPGVGS